MNIRDLLDQPRDVLERWCQQNANYAYLGNSTGLATVLGKYKMYVATDDFSVAPHLIMDGFWEAWVTLALRRVKKGTLAVDIGANHGYFSVLLADLTESTVVAFEPQKRMAALLRRTARANGFKIIVDEAAVGREASTGSLDYSGERDNLGGVQVHKPDGEDVSSLIEIVSLDEALSVTPGFIKIDAEGSEDAIWAGMPKILETRPTILLEFSPQLYSDAEGFLAEIESCYPLREVSEHGDPVEVEASEVLARPEYTMLWLEKED